MTDFVPSYAGLAGWKETPYKEQWNLLALSSPERVPLILAPPALALKLVNLLSPCNSQALLEPLPLF